MLKQFRKFRMFKVLEFFLLNSEKKISISALAKELSISKMTAKHYLDLLRGEGLLESIKVGNQKQFHLVDNYLIREWKKAVILQFLNDLKLSRAVNNSYYIYGSTATGRFDSGSDIDLFVIKIKDINQNKISKISSKIKRKISLIEVPYYELKEYKERNPELIEQVKKGYYVGDEGYGL